MQEDRVQPRGGPLIRLWVIPFAMAVMAAPAPADAARCPPGQFYRVTHRTCVPKSAVPRELHATKTPKRAPQRTRIIRRASNPKPASVTLPWPQVAGPGSINPLPTRKREAWEIW